MIKYALIMIFVAVSVCAIKAWKPPAKGSADRIYYPGDLYG